MLQRIQTLFLILALICVSIFYFFPFGNVIIQNETGLCDIPLSIFGADFLTSDNTETYSTLPLLLLVSFCSLITIANIFLYKHRIVQIRICVFNAMIALGCSGLSIFNLYHASEKYGTDFSTNILVILPIIAAILQFLALRSIAKDEALVRSIDRLR